MFVLLLISNWYPSNFIQCNKEIQQLHMSLRSLRIGTFVAPNAAQDHPENPYFPIATATLSTPVFDVVHMFSERSISAVPIIDEEGIVMNLYETVDVIVRVFPSLPWFISDFLKPYKTLVRLGAYQSLDLKISEALNQRSPDFPGVVVCSPSDSLGTFLQLLKLRRVHRLVVVEGEVSEVNILTTC